MLSFLLAIHFVLTLSIIGLIMLQKHDSDGALGSSGGGAASGMFSVRGQANILTRATAILMTIFIINCLIMAKIVKHTPTQGSIIDKAANESINTNSTQSSKEQSTPLINETAGNNKAILPTDHPINQKTTPAPINTKSPANENKIKNEAPIKHKK